MSLRIALLNAKSVPSPSVSVMRQNNSHAGELGVLTRLNCVFFKRIGERVGGEGRGQGGEERGWGDKTHLSWSVWLCCKADRRENWPEDQKVTISLLKKEEGEEEINSMLHAWN